MNKKLLTGCILFFIHSYAHSSTSNSVLPISDYSNWNQKPYVGVEYGFGGNIFAGYGKIFGPNQKSYIAGEASILTGYPPWYPYGVGVSIIPGVLLTQHTLVYARLGVEKGEANWVAGLGLQTNLAKNWDLRGELNTDNLFKLGVVYKF